MYHVSCDGNPLLDFRDDDLILINPKVKVEVNTVGEGSFKIYKTHPNFGVVDDPRSIFEFSDEYGVFFRGRMTEDSRDFDNGKAVDLEGIMAFFNDSIVRPFSFPEDFKKNSEYISASKSGNVIEFFVKWLIDNHNSQVEPFQRFKLGIVTVADPNNYLSRSDEEYLTTWEALKSKLFDSSLGGYLCIRYEDDGNYIDYLSEFTETNTQGIEYGENLLDLSHDTSRAETYSAIIPLGAKESGNSDKRLTLASLSDDDITDDIVKSGDTLYSRWAVAKYGWKYAPASETTWDDVTTVDHLLQNGLDHILGTAIKETETVEYAAADLHFSDPEIRSFRIYRKVNVNSAPHNLRGAYNLTQLDIDILNPQNTKITTGETRRTLTSYNSDYQSGIKKILKGYATNDRVASEIEKTVVLIEKTDSSITAEVTRAKAAESALSGRIDVEAGRIGLLVNENGTVNASVIVESINGQSGVKISADRINLSGYVTVGDLSGYVTDTELSNKGYQTKSGVVSIIDGRVTADYIEALNISFDNATGDNVNLTGSFMSEAGDSLGRAYMRGGLVSLENSLYGYTTYISIGGNSISILSGRSSLQCSIDHNSATSTIKGMTNQSIVFSTNNAQLVGTWLSSSSEAITSDANRKHDISDLSESYSILLKNLKPRLYKYNDGTSDRVHVGYIAQEVEKAMNSAGLSSQDFAGLVIADIANEETGEHEKMYCLRYDEFIALHTFELQNLSARLDDLAEKLKA